MNTNELIFTIYSIYDTISITILIDDDERTTNAEDIMGNIFISNSILFKQANYFIKTYTEENKNEIKKFITNQKHKYPAVQKLRAFFNKLELNEKYFCVLGEKVISQLDLIEVEYILRKSNLRLIESGEDFERIESLDKILIDYSVNIIGKKRVSIGEKNKSKRVCRFCKKKQGQVSFRNKAHAISEALGNKKLVLLEECDECNKKFGEDFEEDIIKYFSFIKYLYRIRGKGGLKEIQGKNFRLTYRNNKRKIILTKKDGYLKHNTPIVYENVYKSVIKYFLSVINTESLIFFEKTIDWLNGNFKCQALPLMGEIILNNVESEPKLVYYFRKKYQTDIPHSVVEFYLGSKLLVFIVPFSSKDDRLFNKKDDYDSFWKKFSHYHFKTDWNFVDCTNKIDDSLITKYSTK